MDYILLKGIMIVITLLVFGLLIRNYNAMVEPFTNLNNTKGVKDFKSGKAPFIVEYSNEAKTYTLLTSSFINDLQTELPRILSKYVPFTPNLSQNSLNSLQRMRSDRSLFATATDIIILREQSGQLDGHRHTNIRKLCNLCFACPLLFFNPVSNIKTLGDLQGKTIFAGAPGNTSYIVLIDILKALNIRPDVDIKIVETGFQYTPQSLIPGLRDRRIDAVFMVASHPNQLMAQVSREANLNIIGLEGLPDNLLEAIYPFSEPYEFNISEYGINLRYRIKTRLFQVLLCCDVSQPRQIIYHIMKGIIENFEYFKGDIKTPENLIAMLDFNQSNLISNNYLIQHHEGARDYLRDIGFFTDNPDERCGYFAGAGKCRADYITDMRFPNRLML